jgi:hypothetical protein
MVMARIKSKNAVLNSSNWVDAPEFFRKMNAWTGVFLGHRRLIVQRGGFTGAEAEAVFGSDSDSSEIRERVVAWLRQELEKTRKHKHAPVRLQNTMSPLEIADLATELLNNFVDNIPSDIRQGLPFYNLIQLFKELLDVDRHHAAQYRKGKFSDEFFKAACADADAALQGKTIGVRKLASEVGVSPATIITWRKSPDYKKEMRLHAEMRAVDSRDPSFSHGMRKFLEELKEICDNEYNKSAADSGL